MATRRAARGASASPHPGGPRMRFVQANPNEYLVVARRGRINSRGVAGSAFLWPGSTYVRIPSTQQEAAFEMTQESKDSIPLRFKGIVIYRIVDPETAARRFDFTAPLTPTPLPRGERGRGEGGGIDQ